MKKYLNTGVKQVLEQHPHLKPLLIKYNMDCVSCKGNCLFKNIFQAENLSMKDELELKRILQELLK